MTSYWTGRPDDAVAPRPIARSYANFAWPPPGAGKEIVWGCGAGASVVVVARGMVVARGVVVVVVAVVVVEVTGFRERVVEVVASATVVAPAATEVALAATDVDVSAPTLVDTSSTVTVTSTSDVDVSVPVVATVPPSARSRSWSDPPQPAATMIELATARRIQWAPGLRTGRPC
jgi:hypothetical protein